MKSRLLGAVSACVFTFTSITTTQAAPVSSQGTWETTLEGRLETAPGKRCLPSLLRYRSGYHLGGGCQYQRAGFVG